MWWHTPLIPALGRQRQADCWVRGQPGLQSEFQDSQGYTEKPCLQKPKTKTKQVNIHKQIWMEIADQTKAFWENHGKIYIKNVGKARQYLTPLTPALGRQRRVDFWVRGQPGLQSEFQDIQGYTEKPCLKKPKKKSHDINQKLHP